MEAMILAAGDGTRLRPLTDRIPKALIEVHGRPLLAHVMDRLVAAGVTRIVVNAARHADQVAAWLAAHTPAGVSVALNREADGPYETGAGLMAATPLFRREGPFFLHNVDVLSRIPLEGLLAAHRLACASGENPVATLAVQDRETRRQLLFDGSGLAGWEEWGSDGLVRDAKHARALEGPPQRWSFSGVQVVEPAIFDLPHPSGHFSMVAWYLELARHGHRIGAVDVSGHPWLDVGTPARLAEAEAGDW